MSQAVPIVSKVGAQAVSYTTGVHAVRCSGAPAAHDAGIRRVSLGFFTQGGYQKNFTPVRIRLRFITIEIPTSCRCLGQQEAYPSPAFRAVQKVQTEETEARRICREVAAS